jgi:hypothetical protein
MSRLFHAAVEDLDAGMVPGLGYTVLNATGAIVAPFTTANVVPSAVAGNYEVNGGVTLPDTLCKIVWSVGAPVFDEDGIQTNAEAEEWVQAAPDTSTLALQSTLLSVQNKLATMGANVVLQSPVLDDDSASVERGSDYFAADGRALEWNITGGLIPALASSIETVTFKVLDPAGELAIIGTFTLIEDGVKVTFELSSAQTQALTPVQQDFEIIATLNNSHDAKLLEGLLTISD